MTPARIAALDDLGIEWQPAHDAWHRIYGHAAAYYRRTGHLLPGALETVGEPPQRLATWLTSQRTKRRAGTMTSEQIRLLDRIGMIWDPGNTAWERGLAAARS